MTGRFLLPPELRPALMFIVYSRKAERKADIDPTQVKKRSTIWRTTQKSNPSRIFERCAINGLSTVGYLKGGV